MSKEKIEGKLSPYDIESKVERFHWWFVVRKKLLQSLLSSVNVPTNFLAIDIGCGAGSNLTTLKSKGVYPIGLDYSVYALSLAKTKGTFPLLAGDLDNLPIKTESVGLIIAMDIIEHLEDDEHGISELNRVLNKEGVLIITVPAFNSLWGVQDIVTGHKRRYSLRDISRKLRLKGFNILRSSYFNFFLFFPIFLARRFIHLFRLRIESENKINFSLLNTVLKFIFSFEIYILKYFSFPFGVSIYCIAKKNIKG